MKKILLLTCFFVLLICGDCHAKDTTIKYSFADKDEAAKMLLSNKNYLANMNQNDLEYRMQKKGATLKEYKEFLAKQTLNYTDKEKAWIRNTVNELETICDKRGYKLPKTNGIVFAKTTMKEECGAEGYTQGTQIYLCEEALHPGEEYDPFKFILAHELFHVLTRNNPDFRKDMYGLIGFTVAKSNYNLPKSVRDIIVNNPDVERHDSSAVFKIHGENKRCTLILAYDKPFQKKGDSFMNDDMYVPSFVPVDDLSRVYSMKEVDNAWEVFGENTWDIVDPEEALADNFAITLIYGVRDDYYSPWLIDMIDAYLKGNSGAVTPSTIPKSGQTTSTASANPASLSWSAPSRSSGSSNSKGTKSYGKGASKGYYEKSGKGTATYLGPSLKRKAGKATIPAKIKIGKKKYKVTRVASFAFTGYDNLKSVTVGRNVRKIEHDAFSGCNKLKLLRLKTSRLTKKGVKNSLRGSKVNAMGLLQDAQNRLQEYRQIFTKKNSGAAGRVDVKEP